jgi:hypothetical protein
MMFGLKNKPGGKITNRNKKRISGTRETKKLKLK